MAVDANKTLKECSEGHNSLGNKRKMHHHINLALHFSFLGQQNILQHDISMSCKAFSSLFQTNKKSEEKKLPVNQSSKCILFTNLDILDISLP